MFNHQALGGFNVARDNRGTSLAVQWSRLHTSTAGGTGLIPGQGTKILHATARCGQKKKKKRKKERKKKEIAETAPLRQKEQKKKKKRNS